MKNTYMNTGIYVRPLQVEDINMVKALDDCSGNDVGQWVEDNDNIDYAWGAFKGSELIGYATIGGADDCCSTIENYPGKRYDSLLLSDVYIKPEHRKRGYALTLISVILENMSSDNKVLVFLTLLYDSLSYFYKKLGFADIGNACMVKEI